MKVTANGRSAQANVTVTTLAAAPSNLTASASLQNGEPQVQLRWKNNAKNQTGCMIERSSDGGVTWTLIAVLSGTPTSYTDTTVIEGTSYCYRVCAYNALGYSAYCNPVTVTAL